MAAEHSALDPQVVKEGNHISRELADCVRANRSVVTLARPAALQRDDTVSKPLEQRRLHTRARRRRSVG